MKHVHFVSGLFVHMHMLYLLFISAGVWLFVTKSIDLRIQLDSFMTSSLSGAIPKHRCIVGNFNTYPRLATSPRYTRQTADSTHASAGP